MNEKEGTFEIRGFHDFTIVRDSAGCVDVRYKGESVQGVIDVKVRAFNQEEDDPVLVLEIKEGYTKEYKAKLDAIVNEAEKDREATGGRPYMKKMRTED